MATTSATRGTDSAEAKSGLAMGFVSQRGKVSDYLRNFLL
jgi:hypothetical protein